MMLNMKLASFPLQVKRLNEYFIKLSQSIVFIRFLAISTQSFLVFILFYVSIAQTRRQSNKIKEALENEC